MLLPSVHWNCCFDFSYEFAYFSLCLSTFTLFGYFRNTCRVYGYNRNSFDLSLAVFNRIRNNISYLYTWSVILNLNLNWMQFMFVYLTVVNLYNSQSRLLKKGIAIVPAKHSPNLPPGLYQVCTLTFLKKNCVCIPASLPLCSLLFLFLIWFRCCSYCISALHLTKTKWCLMIYLLVFVTLDIRL